MLPAPIWPLAEHASFGQNCCDASIGSVVLFIIHSMPLDVWFFKSSLPFLHFVEGCRYFSTSSFTRSFLCPFPLLNHSKGLVILASICSLRVSDGGASLANICPYSCASFLLTRKTTFVLVWAMAPAKLLSNSSPY